jgi:hypothetical protein
MVFYNWELIHAAYTCCIEVVEVRTNKRYFGEKGAARKLTLGEVFGYQTGLFSFQ